MKFTEEILKNIKYVILDADALNSFKNKTKKLLKYLDKYWKIYIFAFSIGAISSVGSEHLPYKQGVTGSNPVSPTEADNTDVFPLFCYRLYGPLTQLV